VNYYERHLGDYARDTSHLSMLEHGAYGALLDRYYATERPIPAADAHRYAGARTPDERAAVDAVLRDFFHLDGDVYRHHRCDAEIARAYVRIEAARSNGKMGGRPRKNPVGSQWVPSANPVETQHEPSTNPVKSSPDSSLHTPVNTPPSEVAEPPQLALIPTTPRGTALRAVPPSPPPDFNGTNAEALNGKAVVKIAACFELPGEWGLDAEQLGFSPREVSIEAERFRQYWVSGKGAGTRRSVRSWRQSWSNWLSKASERTKR
jgi:uncharacterized protein YdaU (DUF1376 family)